MKFFKWMLYGLGGGAIGAAIWAAVTIVTKYEIGPIAWGVGALCGVAVRYAAREDDDVVGPGVVAVVTAVAAIAAGKFLAVYYLVENEVGQQMVGLPQYDDSSIMIGLADDVATEYEEQGKKLKWPQGFTIENAEQESQYPKEVWSEAKTRFDAMSPAAREQQKNEANQALQQVIADAKAKVREEAFAASFAPMDILFFGLAVVTAFKLGSGFASSS